MKFFHLSDLHLGKRVNEFSMIDDQRHVLDQIVELAREHRPQAALVCGDVYDRPVPPVEAVTLLGDFLLRLNALGVTVCMISGNHDSAERVSFAAPLLRNSRVHIAQAYDGAVAPLMLSDMAESGGLRLDRETTEQLARAEARHARWTRFWLAVGAVSLAVIALKLAI